MSKKVNVKYKILPLIALIITATPAYAGNGDLVVDGKVGAGISSGMVGLVNLQGANSGVVPMISMFNGVGAERVRLAYDVESMNLQLGVGGTPATAQMILDSSGKVGVGISSGMVGLVNLQGTNSGVVPMISMFNGVGAERVRLAYDIGSMKLQFGVGGTPGTAQMTLDASGNLTINGSGLATGGHWDTSDERYKKNITPVQNAMAALLQLEGVSYEWKKPEEYLEAALEVPPPDGQKPENVSGMKVDDIALKKKPEKKNFPGGRHYGVLAQAVEKVLPEVVKTDSNGDKAVNYAGIIPVLIEAIKEQQKIIEKQQKALEVQLDRIEKLERAAN